MTFRIDIPASTIQGSEIRIQDPSIVGGQEIRSALTTVNPVITSGLSTPIDPGNVPTQLYVDGTLYTSVPTEADLTGNTFFFNPNTRQIQLASPLSTSQVTAYLNNSITPRIQSLTRLVSSLKRFHVHSISIDRSWKDQPSAQLVFKAPFPEREKILEELRPGHDYQLLDLGLQISDVQIVESTEVQSDVRELTVTLDFEGKWSGERLRAQPYINPDNLQLGPRNYFNPESSASTIANGAFIPSNTTLQDIAERSGTPLLFPETSVTVPNNASGEVYDWASELDSLADNAESFVYWSNPNGIQIVPFESVSTHIITEGLLRSEVTTSLPRAARDLPGDINTSCRWQTVGFGVASTVLPKLTPNSVVNEPTYRKNFEWEGANLEIPQGALTIAESNPFTVISENEQSSDTRDRWLRRQRTRQVVESGDRSMPSWASNLTETTANFDVTGYTQSFTRTWLLDGEVEREVVEIYGFTFTAEELEAAGGSIDAFSNWQMIEYKDTVHFRAGKVGYYLGYDSQGWRLSRFRQEDKNNPETIGLDPGPEKDLYIVKKLPFAENQSLVLSQFADFYPIDRFANYSFATDAQGNQVLQSDPNYVEPMFVSGEQTIQFAAEFTDNPDDENLPRLVTGKETVTERRIRPLVSNLAPWFRSNSLAALTGTDVGDLNEDEYYIETVNSFSSESTGFDGVAQEDGRDIRKGRPGEAAKLPNRYEQQQLSRDTTNSPAPRSYHLFSEGYDDTPRGSASFPNAVTVGMVENAAKSQLYTNNLQGGLTETFSIIFSPDMREGDKVLLYYNGVLRRRRIQSVSHDIVLDAGINYRASLTTLTVMRDPGYDNPIFDISLRPDVKNSVSFYLFSPLYAGRKLGGFRDISGINRLRTDG